jgi:arabinan endo-1,5-alpha-L-arabinosidase
MKIFSIKKAILLSTLCLFLTCCSSGKEVADKGDDETPVTTNEYLYVNESGSQGVIVSYSEQTSTFNFTIKKGGNKKDGEAKASLRLWTADELKAYNQKNVTAYTFMSSDLYSLVTKDLTFSSTEESKTISIQLKPSAIFKAMKTNSAELTIPLKLESSSYKIQENRCDIIVRVFMNAPTISFIIGSDNGVMMKNKSQTFSVDTKYTYKENGKIVSNPWDFTCSLSIPSNANELIAKYNTTNSSNFKLIPASAVTLNNIKYTAGSATASANIVIDRTKLEPALYLLPLKMSDASNENILCDSIINYVVVSMSYANPIIDANAPDPTVIRAQDGYFYLYATEGSKYIPIYRSDDMANWTLIGGAFTDATRPSWESGHSLWAPEIRYFNGHYVLYYAFAKWGDEWDSHIGVAIADSPAGPFTDKGCLINAKTIGVQNSIDGFFIEDNGNKYFFWGSFSGIYATQLTDDGLAVKTGSDNKPTLLKRICGNKFEATNIYKHGDYYYLFASIGSCCDGANSTYTTVVGDARKAY